MELTEETMVYVLANEEYRFVGLMELASDRKWVYGFTSPQKAEDFLRIARQGGGFTEANRIFPCTLGEWFGMQEKQGLPDLAIDPDPEQNRDYPGMVGDMAKHNITCMTTGLPNGGKLYRVAVSDRTDRKKP
jgi:hypothetical protein